MSHHYKPLERRARDILGPFLLQSETPNQRAHTVAKVSTEQLNRQYLCTLTRMKFGMGVLAKGV